MRTYLSNLLGFLNSNTGIAKFAFIILLIIIFIALLNLGTKILKYFLGPSPTPHFIDGMIESSDLKEVQVNPNIIGSKPVLKSDNLEKGLEFTWVFIKQDGNYDDMNRFQHVFHKGDRDFNEDNIDSQHGNIDYYCPGIFITKMPGKTVPSAGTKGDSGYLSIKTVVTIFNTIHGPENKMIDINDIPSNKWLNVIVRVSGNVLDVYLNGTLKGRELLEGVALQNHGNVFIGKPPIGGGSNSFGFISNVWYWNYALGLTEIENVVNAGPNKTMVDKKQDAVPEYLSFNWFIRDDVPSVAP